MSAGKDTEDLSIAGEKGQQCCCGQQMTVWTILLTI
jgi:hypothetical protein